jgi:FkbM family methyltransferase
MKHFFDIGGNAGQTFDYIETLGRDFSDYWFWVFEPSPRHFAKLLEKCARVNYRVTVCPFGLGGKTELRRFYEKDDALGDSFQPVLASDHDVHNADNGYEIMGSVISLPEFILAHTKFGDEIILDIDAEGNEYEMLAALIHSPALNRVGEVMVEWHHVPEEFISPRYFAEVCAYWKIRLTNRGHAWQS